MTGKRTCPVTITGCRNPPYVPEAGSTEHLRYVVQIKSACTHFLEASIYRSFCLESQCHYRGWGYEEIHAEHSFNKSKGPRTIKAPGIPIGAPKNLRVIQVQMPFVLYQ